MNQSDHSGALPPGIARRRVLGGLAGAGAGQGTKLVYLLAESITPVTKDFEQWQIKLRPGIFLGPVDLKNTKKLDGQTVLVKLTSPVSAYPEQLAAATFDLRIAPTTLNPAKPNGTGAFKYKSFAPGQRSVFTRNPHYWQHGLPYVDTLTIIDFADNTSLANAAADAYSTQITGYAPTRLGQPLTNYGFARFAFTGAKQ